MKTFIENVIVSNETIIEFLAWAGTQPKGQNKITLIVEEVPEPRS